ncbi:MAG: hypothetical protein ACRDO4_14825, partial [Nocardioides sp.]
MTAASDATLDPHVADRLRRHYARRHTLARAGLYAVAVLAALACAGPFVWSALTATKLNADLYNPTN